MWLWRARLWAILQGKRQTSVTFLHSHHLTFAWSLRGILVPWPVLIMTKRSTRGQQCASLFPVYNVVVAFPFPSQEGARMWGFDHRKLKCEGRRNLRFNKPLGWVRSGAAFMKSESGMVNWEIQALGSNLTPTTHPSAPDLLPASVSPL